MVMAPLQNHCYASFPAKAIIYTPNKEFVIVIAQNALFPLY